MTTDSGVSFDCYASNLCKQLKLAVAFVCIRFLSLHQINGTCDVRANNSNFKRNLEEAVMKHIYFEVYIFPSLFITARALFFLWAFPRIRKLLQKSALVFSDAFIYYILYYSSLYFHFIFHCFSRFFPNGGKKRTEPGKTTNPPKKSFCFDIPGLVHLQFVAKEVVVNNEYFWALLKRSLELFY